MPEVIAHRGASADAPENTWAAFDLALAQGADALELDLRATADGHAVVLHDPTLLRTHGDPRAIAEVRLADAPAGLPTLPAVLERYAGRTRLLLELKVPLPLACVTGLPGVVVQSFDRPALRRAVRADPALRVAPLFAVRPTPRQLDRAARHAEGVGIPHALVDAQLVAAAHHRGLRVRAWTANAAADLARLSTLGVDGLITDLPTLALAATAAAPLSAAA
ncbi:MAG: hypothetical protein JWO90_769 [Solirubrobacterales bacterium]|nr:hypothetical protein [Solirubrobacterales bacterium]